MDNRQLRYFVAIVDAGSLSRASKRLHVAQPALSQQLAKLEDQVGKPLLIRSSKGVEPTENGLALYHHARLILRQLEQALSIARSESAAMQGMVTIGLPATTVATIGLEIVRRVRRKYPGVLLNVVEAMSGHIQHMVRQNELDLAVLFNGDASDDLTVEPILVEELFLISSGDSPFAPEGRDHVTVREAAAMPLILPTSAHGLRRRIEQAFESRALKANVVAEIDSLSLLMDCVGENIGVTIKPAGAILQEKSRGRSWRRFSFSDAQLRRSNYLYSLPPDRLSPAAALVVGELKATVRDLVEDPEVTGFEAAPAEEALAGVVG